MTAKVISGAEVAAEIREELKAKKLTMFTMKIQGK